MDTKSNNYSISGMMGYCIWAYETGELHDAKKLLDSIFENYSKINTVDLMTGFAGVGWGIEYLAQRQFIEANTDEMLENIDDVLFRLRRQRKKLYELGDSLFEYGLYFLSRAKGGEANNCSTSISKKWYWRFS